MSVSAPTLLFMKLNRPPVMDDRIDQPRLLQMLHRSLPGPLSLVSAAGYSRTDRVCASAYPGGVAVAG